MSYMYIHVLLKVPTRISEDVSPPGPETVTL